MSVCYTMTEMLLIGHSERQLKADYLNEHNISSLTSDVYTMEHFLNVWQIKLNATLATKFNFTQQFCFNPRTVNKANLQLTTLWETSRYSRAPCSLRVSDYTLQLVGQSQLLFTFTFGQE